MMGSEMSFDEVIEVLDHYTAPPKDGDYDQHTLLAMRAVYDLVAPVPNRIEDE